MIDKDTAKNGPGNRLHASLMKLQARYSGLDPDWYLDQIQQFAENEWFMPEADKYAICNDLYTWHMIEQWRIPLWKDGSYKGDRIFFRYRLDMDYARNAA